MENILKFLIGVVLISSVSGCGSYVIKYEPQPEMTLEEAGWIVDRLIMEQHKAWRPDFVEINDQYISLGYGTVTRGSGSAVVINNLVLGSSSSTTRAAGERVYYDSTDKVVLYSWKRKFKQWYIASLSGKKRNHLLRTRDLDEAKKMVDALQVILNEFKEKNLRQQEKEAAFSASH
jgi:hypothetical protein